MNGIVLIDKPAGCTSHDVVNRWRKLAETKRTGHLGTLDPMATGLLVLVTGTATRLAQFYGSHEKTYEAEIRLGCVSDTYDAEGEVMVTGVAAPAPELVIGALDAFRGKLWQTPPPVSAKKIKGVAAYKLARKQQPVELTPVEIDVKELVIHQVGDGTVKLSVRCSAGTYIRGIAHDLGQKLGCGAILASLRRTASGEFHVSAAKTIRELEELAGAGRLETAVIPSAKLLSAFPSAFVDETEQAHIRQGREFRTSPFVVPPGAPFVKAISFSGELISIGQLKFANVYHPMIVL
jgi:tRNA pseudouridine55 synthase